MKVLANDGIAPEGVKVLEAKGFKVSTTNVPQEQLIDAINKEGYTALLVRSATTVRKDLIDACPGLKLIGRGGVGMDNIDVEYARSKGIHVINTPAASSQSVAELVMGNLFSLSRFVFQANRTMPEKGDTDFKRLKKAYADGQEVRGKTLGIIGFGKIGQALAAYALGVGMKVRAIDPFVESAKISVNIEFHGPVKVMVDTEKELRDVIGDLDYISLHIPKTKNGEAVIGKDEFDLMKEGVIIANAARGGVMDEDALIQALNSGKVRAAALDVFENEPNPRKDLLQHERILSTPHIGAATDEAQSRIGIELAEQIINLLT
ncbi:MAG: D-2-hydroxyacid dehydrogenase [Crocinitomicaceae bacterium]